MNIINIFIVYINKHESKHKIMFSKIFNLAYHNNTQTLPYYQPF